MHPGQPRADQYPPSIPALTGAEIIPWTRLPSPGVDGAVEDLLHVPGRDALADDRADDRDGEPLAQPPLGMPVLAGPLPLDRQPPRRQVERDQVRARPLQIRRAGGEPLSDLLQSGRELVLRRRLALTQLPFSYHTARHRSPGPRAGYTVTPAQ